MKTLHQNILQPWQIFTTSDWGNRNADSGCWIYNVKLLLLLQPFNGLFSRTTWVSRYQKGKTNLDFTGARDSEWQWHQMGHMQVCISLQTDNHASTPSLCFLQAGCPSCRPTNSVKALKAQWIYAVKRKRNTSSQVLRKNNWSKWLISYFLKLQSYSSQYYHYCSTLIHKVIHVIQYSDLFWF